jgi:hypothetical protein
MADSSQLALDRAQRAIEAARHLLIRITLHLQQRQRAQVVVAQLVQQVAKRFDRRDA